MDSIRRSGHPVRAFALVDLRLQGHPRHELALVLVRWSLCADRRQSALINHARSCRGTPRLSNGRAPVG